MEEFESDLGVLDSIIKSLPSARPKVVGLLEESSEAVK
jgi:hypothetical protein